MKKASKLPDNPNLARFLRNRDGRRVWYKFLSDDAFECVELIGCGLFVLRRYPDGRLQLMPRTDWPHKVEHLESQEITAQTFQEMEKHHVLGKLPERMENMKIGWRDKGFPGEDGSDFYLLAQ